MIAAMTATTRIISRLVQRQIDRGFEPTWESDRYRSDWKDGLDHSRTGKRCPRWQTDAFKCGYRDGRLLSAALGVELPR